MYKLDLPIDKDEAAIIDKRRRREEERRSRIFNDRLRCLGIDKQALKQQIAEKEERELKESLRSEAYGADAVRYDKIACILENQTKRDKAELNRNLNEFRFLHQQPTSRREFDLYDPDALKKDIPARVSDDDPRCGIASLQKFLGEDLNFQARNKYQREQMQSWFDRQIEERMRAECAKKEAERLEGLKRCELDQRALELTKAENDCRRAINIATRRLNAALRVEQEQRRLQKIKQEQDDNMTEICNAIYSDLLTENPAQATSAFGSHRVIPDRFKGFSNEQKKNIRDIQLEQIDERKRIHEEEKQLDSQWDEQRLRSAKLGLLLQRELDRSAAELKRRLADENLRIAMEQKSHHDHMNKEVYTNEPTAAYFTQFNTTSR